VNDYLLYYSVCVVSMKLGLGTVAIGETNYEIW